jgi:hypothetical protein
MLERSGVATRTRRLLTALALVVACGMAVPRPAAAAVADGGFVRLPNGDI